MAYFNELDTCCGARAQLCRRSSAACAWSRASAAAANYSDVPQDFTWAIVESKLPCYNLIMKTIADISAVVCDVMSHYDIREVYLFGSYARGDERSDSDIDLRFVCGPTVTFGTLYEIAESLESRLGVKVEIVTSPLSEMRAGFRENVLRDEVKLYEAA